MNPKIQEVLELPTTDLLILFGEIIEKLRDRKIVRSFNNPVGDYAEFLVQSALSLQSTPGSNKDFDAVDLNNIRYQIKGRRLTKQNQSRQLSTIRNLNSKNFDFLVGVLFNEDFTVRSACQIPYDVVLKNSSFKKSVNGTFICEIRCGRFLAFWTSRPKLGK